MGLATLEGGANDCSGGPDKTVRTSLDLVFTSTVETAMASIMARMVVAVTRWRIPLVPRETDELPFPTDRKSLWISTLDKNAVTAGGRCVN